MNGFDQLHLLILVDLGLFLSLSFFPHLDIGFFFLVFERVVGVC